MKKSEFIAKYTIKNETYPNFYVLIKEGEIVKIELNNYVN